MVVVGQTEAVVELYSHHHGWLRGWLRKKMGCAEQAADIAHDTFERILLTQDRGLTLREPRAYLTTVASRLVVNFYRRLTLERAYLDALSQMPESLAPSPEAHLSVLETLHEIDAMLDALPPKARTAFLLSQLEGLTYAEIANQLGINVRTVKRYMVLAMEECIVLAGDGA